MIVIDSSTGPMGFTALGITTYLEVEGNRYELETAHLKINAKELVEKWTRHARALNMSITITENATKYVS